VAPPLTHPPDFLQGMRPRIGREINHRLALSAERDDLRTTAKDYPTYTSKRRDVDRLGGQYWKPRNRKIPTAPFTRTIRIGPRLITKAGSSPLA
jgi:hypothetical protein